MKKITQLLVLLALTITTLNAQITSVTPNVGNIGDNVTITITGQNLTTQFDTVAYTEIYLSTFIDTSYVRVDLTNLTGTDGTTVTGDLSIDSGIVQSGVYTMNYKRGVNQYSMDSAFIINVQTVGSFTISGVLREGTGKTTAEGDPVANATLYLVDVNTGNIVKVVSTDAAGNYVFENLEEGDYAIHHGNANNATPIQVKVSAANTSANEGLDIVLNSQGIQEEESPTNIQSLETIYGLTIVNSVVKNDLSFKVEQLNTPLEITIYSIIGSRMLNEIYTEISNTNRIDLSTLNSGYYFASFKINNKVATYKLIKE